MRTPCIIFIDEIDTVGAKRTSSQIHPYANQTINQLLSEMDGSASCSFVSSGFTSKIETVGIISFIFVFCHLLVDANGV